MVEAEGDGVMRYPLSRIAGEGAERSEAGEGLGRPDGRHRRAGRGSAAPSPRSLLAVFAVFCSENRAIGFAPPLCISTDEVDLLICRLRQTLDTVLNLKELRQ